uniref:Benzyl alcohol O-benzoyltransferase n=1 Tax=Ananas comosus var. bracteatus TaxID=296719 RepID=A0A6V7PJH4_ANACO|nr:unnamed protein product [Ananas comosus var. bracteatus]
MAVPRSEMVRERFFFGPKEIAALRKRAPPHLRASSSRFELITSCIWRSRTAALGYGPDEEVRVSFIVNARGRSSIPVPPGYYGNAYAFSVASSTAEKLTGSPIGYALELVKKAKANVTYEYLQSVADLMVLRGRPLFTVARTYIVSDISHAGFKDVDFGWGRLSTGAPPRAGGPHPRRRQLLLALQERQGRGGHRRARLPAARRHGEVPLRGPKPHQGARVRPLRATRRPVLIHQLGFQLKTSYPEIRELDSKRRAPLYIVNNDESRARIIVYNSNIDIEIMTEDQQSRKKIIWEEEDITRFIINVEPTEVSLTSLCFVI